MSAIVPPETPGIISAHPIANPNVCHEIIRNRIHLEIYF